MAWFVETGMAALEQLLEKSGGSLADLERQLRAATRST